MMAPAKADKGIPRKPMRQQLRGENRKAKKVKTNQKQRHGKLLQPYRKPKK